MVSEGIRGVGNRPPIIISAKIYPDLPTAEKPLTAHFSGEDAEGDTIRCVFRWYVDGALVQEGPDGNLQPGPYRKDSKVFVEVIPSDKFSSGALYKSDTITIGNAPPVVSSISLTPGNPRAGDVITAAPVVTDPDGDWTKNAYQWYVNDKPATEPGAEDRFSTAGLKKKDKVNVSVTPTDGESTGDPKVSNTIMIANSPPRIASNPPTALANGTYRYEVLALDPDGDRLTYALAKAPQGMTINPSTGLITWEPKPVNAREEVAVKIVVNDGDGGSMDQEYSVILEP